MVKVSPVTGQKDYPGTNWQITSGYATQAYFNQFGSWHTGHDLARTLDGGEPVYAVSDGIVKYADSVGATGFGNLVFIKHGDNLFTRYAHLREIFVRYNDPIHAGQMIGRVGNTGRATGNHLHFDVMTKSNALDWPGKERERLLQQYLDPRVWFGDPFTIDLPASIEPEKRRVVAPAGINIREKPGTSGTKLYALAYDSIVEVKPIQLYANDLAWCELVSGGWAAAKYLEPVSV